MAASPMSEKEPPVIVGGDPLLQPVDGVSLEMYATAAQEAHLRGIADEDGLAAVAEEVYAVPAPVARAAFATWVERMAVSPAVGRELRTHMGY